MTTQQSFTLLMLEWYSHSAVNVAVPPLPVLFASQNNTEFTVPGQPSLTLPDFATTPRGKCGWPLKYVCDMHQGFERMQALQDGLPPMKTEEAFTPVFSAKYKASTFNDQEHAWHVVGEILGEHDKWIAHRRTEAGEWAKFMQVWRCSLRVKSGGS